MMDKKNITIIICCAGIDTKLGIGVAKSLIKINGKTLIRRQLELLDGYDDVRVVVGYQADQIIEETLKYRRDLMYAFNHDYRNTGAAASLYKGAKGARDFIVFIEGDILIEPEDFKRFLEADGECIASTEKKSKYPIGLNIKDNMAWGIGEKYCDEWPGLVKIKTTAIDYSEGYI